MPRFYFHLHNDPDVPDLEGREFPDLPAAHAEAMREARVLIGDGQDRRQACAQSPDRCRGRARSCADKRLLPRRGSNRSLAQARAE
ncbi:DUF6894 family protein [Sphingomonas arenae]|uniref:DUF6894 family protein n=1 Tax=Sphingomonas arenae TaxID=2812555 RepID=UPI003AF6F013